MLIAPDNGYIKGSRAYKPILTRSERMPKTAYNQPSETQVFLAHPHFDTETNKQKKQNRSCKGQSPLLTFIIKGNKTEDAHYFTVAETTHMSATSSKTHSQSLRKLTGNFMPMKNVE